MILCDCGIILSVNWSRWGCLYRTQPAMPCFVLCFPNKVRAPWLNIQGSLQPASCSPSWLSLGSCPQMLASALPIWGQGLPFTPLLQLCIDPSSHLFIPTQYKDSFNVIPCLHFPRRLNFSYLISMEWFICSICALSLYTHTHTYTVLHAYIHVNIHS